MLRIANEERPWMEMLPTQGATIGELTLSMQQYPVQQGTLFTIHYHNELGRVWIAEQCWQRWCEGLIGTANRSVIDPELLYGIAEWGWRRYCKPVMPPSVRTNRQHPAVIYHIS